MNMRYASHQTLQPYSHNRTSVAGFLFMFNSAQFICWEEWGLSNGWLPPFRPPFKCGDHTMMLRWRGFWRMWENPSERVRLW